jgi:hypothetical protein
MRNDKNNYICPSINRDLLTFDAIIDIRNKLKMAFSMEIIMLAAWSIWIIRNNKIFNNQRHDQVLESDFLNKRSSS